MYKELAQQYDTNALQQIADAAKFHAELIAKYDTGQGRIYAKQFGDVYLSLTHLINMAKG